MCVCVCVCVCVAWVHACSVAKSYPTLCDTMDCSPPGSSVHGVLQARILEWVAIFFSRGSSLTQGSNPCLLHWQADSLALNHQGSSMNIHLSELLCCIGEINTTWKIKYTSIKKNKNNHNTGSRTRVKRQPRRGQSSLGQHPRRGVAWWSWGIN